MDFKQKARSMSERAFCFFASTKITGAFERAFYKYDKSISQFYDE